ncbi:MAG TPA: hypothetical protein VHY37_05185 [Tepidisphaeraceae bacterium]|jgi:hypothetical protein|nr:hypothetical protein [Tepidisphaeraceae bacterium]
MPESETLPNEPGWHIFTCPGCGEAVDVSAEAVGKFATCPYCNAQFSPEDQDAEAADALAHAHDEARREAELSALRIRAVATERRAVVRTRSYWIILLLALCIASVKLFMMASSLFGESHSKHWMEPLAYVLAAVVCLSAAPWPIWKIRALNAELRKPMLEEPTTPPDFSTLSDGSQRWKNLEQLK